MLGLREHLSAANNLKKCIKIYIIVLSLSLADTVSKYKFGKQINHWFVILMNAQDYCTVHLKILQILRL